MVHHLSCPLHQSAGSGSIVFGSRDYWELTNKNEVTRYYGDFIVGGEGGWLGSGRGELNADGDPDVTRGRLSLALNSHQGY